MSEVKGKHVLFVLLAFFGVTIAVNAAMATYAITTFSGEDISDPYMKGLAFNKTLAAHSAQAQLGWSATIEAERTPAGTNVEVALTNRQSAPLTGLTVAMTLRRPTNAKLDRTIALTPASNGRYTATIKDLPAGAWDMIANTKDGDIPFEATRRVLLK